MNERKNLLYGNYSVYSPDGKLMFRCSDKRANWYLSRKLATIDPKNPFNISLNFIPKGSGETCEALKVKRLNKCSVCGCEEIERLTKHHIVPLLFRKHFPNNLKRHRSHLNIPLCRECHDIYEGKYLQEIKSQFMTNENEDKAVSKEFRVIGSYSAVLLKNNNLPENIKQKLLDELFRLCLKHNIPFDINNLAVSLLNIVKEKHFDKLIDANRKAKIVIDQLNKENKLPEFEKLWINHFVDKMKPKFLPQEIINHLNSYKN